MMEQQVIDRLMDTVQREKARADAAEQRAKTAEAKVRELAEMLVAARAALNWIASHPRGCSDHDAAEQMQNMATNTLNAIAAMTTKAG